MNAIAALPQAWIESEAEIIGSIILDPSTWNVVAGTLTAERFSDPSHARIYQVIDDLCAKGQKPTIGAIADALPAGEPVPGMSWRQYLARIAADFALPATAKDTARRITDIYAARCIITIGQEARDAIGGSDPGEIARDAFERVEKLRNDIAGRSDAQAILGDLASSVVAMTNEIMAGRAVNKAVPSGLADYDRITGGYRPGTLVVIGARPGMGKTALMVSMARRAAQSGQGVIEFSLEVPQDELAARHLAEISWSSGRTICFGDIQRGTISDADLMAIGRAQEKLGSLPIIVNYASRLTVPEIQAFVRAQKKRLAKHGKTLGVIFIDYLGFIKASDRYRGNRVHEVGEISRGLKEMAKDEDICVVLLSQLNRGVESRDNKRPIMSDLRDSGDLEQDAHIVGLLYREAYYLEQSPAFQSGDADVVRRFADCQNKLELILAKNRSGQATTIDLFCDVAASRVDNMRKW